MLIIGYRDGSIKKILPPNLNENIKGYKTHTIIGGEFAISHDTDGVAFRTLLGSCVAIIFYDKINKIKGMNHFLLPFTDNTNDDMKYGLYSVEAMLNEMYKLGCKKKDIVAKISGGADVLNLTVDKRSVGYRNVEFAIDFCQSEGIEIVSNHIRGNRGKIVLVTINFDTYIKSIDNNFTNKIINEERKLQTEISTRKPVLSEYTTNTDLFGISQDDDMWVELF